MTARKKKNPVPVSKEVLDAAEKIIQKAFACKTNEDFRDTVALDNIFKDVYGKSALTMAGISIGIEPDVKTQYAEDSDGCSEYYTEVKYHYTWLHNLLPVLPEDQEHFEYGCDVED